MIKKQQKWIALMVTLTFIWLLHVSTMPLAAVNSPEQVNSANAEQGPDYLEAVGYKAAPAKGKSILPLILIGVGVVAVAAVLFLVVLKTKYDIVGTWNYTSTGKWPVTGQIVFTGTKESGTVSWVGLVDVGTYSVDGKNVTFTFGYQQYGTTTCTGKFNGKNEISGTYLYTDEHNTDTATFTMTR